MGHLLQMTVGNQHLVVFINYLTKWPEVYAIPNAKAVTMAKVFVEQTYSKHSTGQPRGGRLKGSHQASS